MSLQPYEAQTQVDQNLAKMKTLTWVAGIFGVATFMCLILCAIISPKLMPLSFLLLIPALVSAIRAMIIGNQNIDLLKIIRAHDEKVISKRIRNLF